MLRNTDANAKLRSDFAEISIATTGGLALALIAIFLCIVPLSGNATSTRDYVVFWATGQQLIRHGNPYDPAAMDHLERSAGLGAEYGTLYMRNPPWALALTLPLGAVNEQIGGLLWSLALLASLVISGLLVRAMFGNPPNRIHWIAFSFAPSLICLFMGQTTLFALLGLTVFLRFHRTSPFIGGAALWLCSIKPHLLLPFGTVLLVWVFTSKAYRILAGALLALVASCALTWLIAPSAWSGYFAMMHTQSVEREFIPCLSVTIRLLFRPDAIWLQYVADVVVCAWALLYYWRRRVSWNWLHHGGVLILASLVAAPYCWPYDQTLAIPALLQSAYTTHSRTMLAVLPLASIPIMGAIMAGIKIATPLYVLIAPAWLVLYLLLQNIGGNSDRALTAESSISCHGGSR